MYHPQMTRRHKHKFLVTISTFFSNRTKSDTRDPVGKLPQRTKYPYFQCNEWRADYTIEEGNICTGGHPAIHG